MNVGGDPCDAETKATAFGMTAGIPGPISATTSVTLLSAHETIRRLAGYSASRQRQLIEPATEKERLRSIIGVNWIEYGHLGGIAR